MMLNCDPSGRFVDQYLTLIIDYFSCTPMCADNFNQLSLEIFCIHVRRFYLYVIFVTSASDRVTYLIQINEISFVETGKNAEFSLWQNKYLS